MRRHPDGTHTMDVHMTTATIHPARAAHSIAETCALTGLGRDSIYSAIRSGKLLARKLGKRTLVTDDDLRRFLAGLPRAGGHEQG